MKIYDVAIIGAGPAGIMAAITASKNSDVILIDKNNSIGRKLKITGNGRCNLTNNRDISEFFDYITRNSNFLYSSLYKFSNHDLIRLIKNAGVDLKVEDDEKVFPVTDNSKDIIDALYSQLNRTRLALNTNVESVYLNNKIFELITNNGIIKAKSLIIATGGISYPVTGSTGDGYKFAKSLGHNITSLKPSLNSISLNLNTLSLAGISLRDTEIKVYNKNKLLTKFIGDILFTHKGVTGPLCYIVSDFITDFNDSDIKLCLNVFPNHSINEVEKILNEYFENNKNKEIKSLFYSYMPKSFSDYLFEFLKIDKTNKINSISREDKIAILDILTNLDLNYDKIDCIKSATITKGGIDVKYINPSTMESRLVENLYFCGEVLDVSALTGGYNLQIAFSTGYVAGLESSNKR